MISSLFSLQLALKFVPFITIFQILFSKYFVELGKTDHDVILFDSFSGFFQGHWHHIYDFFSVFTCTRYLYKFAQEAINSDLSWNKVCFYIAIFILIPFFITLFKLKTIDID